MKKYNIYHDGLVYAVTAYGYNKRDAIKRYREQWDLVGKRINLEIWNVA